MPKPTLLYGSKTCVPALKDLNKIQYADILKSC